MILPIPRYPDSLILAKLEKIGNSLGKREWRVTVSGESWQLFEITVPVGANDPWKSHVVAREIAAGSGISARTFNFHVDGTHVASITRQEAQPQDQLTTNQQWFSPDNDENRLRFAKANEALNREFMVSRSAIGQLVGTTGELAQFVEARDQGLTRLEELYSRLTRALVEDRQRAEEEITNRKRGLEELEQKLRTDLDAERNALAEATAKERDALAARLKEVDDRAATVARRQIRRDLKDEFKKRQTAFGVTKDTQAKRWPVAAAVLSLAVLFGAGFGWYVYEFVVRPPSGNALYIAIIRQVLLGIGFGGAIWYYIHWQNAWFQRHADEEFKLKRLELDFDRASWVVELAMEWSKEKTGQEIPESVMRELTRNLFADGGGGSKAAKPDVFSALLDASTKAEIAVGDAKFALNRSGAKRLKETLDNEE